MIVDTRKISEVTMAVITRCPLCGEEQPEFEVSRQGWWDWNHRTPIQVAFPELTEDQREALTSGICPPCWEDTFADPDAGEE